MLKIKWRNLDALYMITYSKKLIKRAQKLIIKEYGLKASEEQAERYLDCWADLFFKVYLEILKLETPKF